MAAVMAPAARPNAGLVLVAGSAALALLIFLEPATARAEGDLALRATLDEVRAKHDVPALWAGRFHADGRRVFAVSGVRKHGEVDPARLDDLVHIGSCTKAMTAVMVARRCSRETLTFDPRLPNCSLPSAACSGLDEERVVLEAESAGELPRARVGGLAGAVGKRDRLRQRRMERPARADDRPHVGPVGGERAPVVPHRPEGD